VPIFASGLTHKYHPNPRLSANQISDYVFSLSALRRRSILRDAKYPRIAIVIKYDEARLAIRKHLSGSGSGKNILADSLLTLQRRIGDEDMADGRKKDFKLSIAAIEAFQFNEAEFGFSKLTFKPSPINSPKLAIANVSISVSLDLVVEKPAKTGAKSVGAVVFIFSKTGGQEKNVDKRCKTVAMLTYQTLKTYLKTHDTVDPKLCMAVDVFSGRVYAAKTEQKQLFTNVQTNCEDVATIWPGVKPPKNYKGPPIPKS
jgi:hypothetical protein